MGCRCYDISRCSQDIATLQDAIHKVQSVSSQVIQTHNTFAQLQRTETDSFHAEPAERQKIQHARQRKAQAIEQEMAGGAHTLQSRISQMQSQLQQMRNEDRWHHEEEARRAREAQEEAARQNNKRGGK